MQQTQDITVSWIPEMYLGESVDIVVIAPAHLFSDYADLTFCVDHTSDILTPKGDLVERGNQLIKTEELRGNPDESQLRFYLSVRAQEATQKKFIQLTLENVDLVQKVKYRAELELTIFRDPTQVNVHVAGNMQGSTVYTDNEGNKLSARASCVTFREISREAVNPLVAENYLFQKRYQLKELLGTGGFGSVWKANIVGQSGNKANVALKFITMSSANNPREKRMLEREADKLESLRHENIIAFRSLENEANLWALSLEYASGGSLDLQLQHQERGYFTTDEIKPWVEQILDALVYLHGKKILHRDIKPHNILIDANGKIKITDFGLSSRLKNTLSRNSQDKMDKPDTSGTLVYTAPQVLLRDGSYTIQEDLYSLGILIYELLTRVTPFDDVNDDLIYHYIKDESMKMPSMMETGEELYGEEFPQIDQQWIELVERLTAYQRVDRVTSANEAQVVLRGKSEKQQRKQAVGQEELERAQREQQQQLVEEREQEKKQQIKSLMDELSDLFARNDWDSFDEKLAAFKALAPEHALVSWYGNVKKEGLKKIQQETDEERKKEEERLKEAQNIQYQGEPVVNFAEAPVPHGSLDFNIGDKWTWASASRRQVTEKQQIEEGDRKAGERREFEIANGIVVAFCWCPAGEFLMGSPEGEQDRLNGETQHQVTLSMGFWMADTQCTQRLWDCIMEDNPSYFTGEMLPVDNVSWVDVCQFIEKLNRLLKLPQGYYFSLPTEAQWEYACRAGNKGNYGGSGDLDEMGWYKHNSEDKTQPVGKKKENAWNLYDMHGNVSEWCSDWYGAYGEGCETDPKGSSIGKSRVLRGGCWSDSAWICRSARRGSSAPSVRSNVGNGFRLALQVSES